MNTEEKKAKKLEEEIIAIAKVQVSHTLKGDSTVWDEYVEQCVERYYDPRNNTVIATEHVLIACEGLCEDMSIDPFVMGRCIIEVEQFVVALRAGTVSPIF